MKKKLRISIEEIRRAGGEQSRKEAQITEKKKLNPTLDERDDSQN